MQFLIENVASVIFKEIGLDSNKMIAVRSAVTEVFIQDPLFNNNLDFTNMMELKIKVDAFLDKCLNNVLERII